jgi:hypothetical protein
MPRRKDEIGTTTTQVKEGINPNNTNRLGATRTKDTKTPKGALIPIYHAKGRTTIFELPVLALYVMSMDIILIIAPKFLTSNG